jgi:hypothetical protein
MIHDFGSGRSSKSKSPYRLKLIKVKEEIPVDKARFIAGYWEWRKLGNISPVGRKSQLRVEQADTDFIKIEFSLNSEKAFPR